MWSPTHVKVTVQKARGLLIKGKNGVNDAFVTIALGKEKYQTSVQEKAPANVEWHEECDLEIPKHGNTAGITLTAFHRNFLGVDEFLGTVSIPLAEFDVYERPRNRWYMLRGKPGKEKGKDKARGELEVKVGFLVKSGSLSDLSKRDKHKSSLGQLTHMAHSVGGSLLSMGSLEKKKGLKKLAKSLGRVGRGSRKSHDGTFPTHDRGQHIGDADPGVISEGDSDDEFRFDELSHKSSGSSLNTHGAHHTPVSGSMENLAGGEFLRRSASGHSSGPPLKPPRALANPTGPPAQAPTDEWEQKLCGWKDTSPADTLTRRAVLHIQPEEDEEPQPPAANLTVPWPPPQHSSAPTTPNVSASHAIAVASVAAASIGSSGSPLMPGSPGLSAAQKFNSTSGSQQSIGSGSGAGDDEEKEQRAKDKVNLKSKLKQFLAKDAKPSNAPPDQLAERIIIGRERDRAAASSPEQNAKLPPEVLSKYESKSKEDLVQMLADLQRRHDSQAKRLSDLEDYLDQLLLRVMEATPGLLQNPFVSCKAQAHFTVYVANVDAVFE